MDLFALALIQKAHTVGCYLAAICAAPTLLAHLGCWTAAARSATPAWRERWAPPRGPAGVSCGSGRTHHHRPLRRLRL